MSLKRYDNLAKIIQWLQPLIENPFITANMNTVLGLIETKIYQNCLYDTFKLDFRNMSFLKQNYFRHIATKSYRSGWPNIMI